MNISFGAKILSKEKILKYNRNLDSYNQADVSFVEINPQNSNDYIALSEAVKCWQNDSYGANIAHTVLELKKGYIDSENHKVYALTSQKNDFHNLNSLNIIGLAEMELESGSIPYLRYLQVNPDYIDQFYNFEPNKFKGAGTSLLNSLKKIYQSILLKASSSGLKYFYEKNNFKLVDNLERKYLWKNF